MAGSKSLLSLLLILVVLQIESKSSDLPFQSTVLNKHEKLIVLSFDGFRYDYLDKASVSAPNLKWLRQHGVSTPYTNPQFMTKTFVNHQSFVTGLYAESHGIIDNKIFDPLYGEILQVKDVRSDERLWNFRPDVVPIWTLNEWAGDGRISGAQFPGANEPYGLNRTLPTHYLDYDYNRTFEKRIDYVYSWLTNETHPANLVFMYFHEPDAAGHEHGPESDEVVEQIERLDKILKYLLDKLKDGGIEEQINIIVWSDHGMEEVTIRKRINLKGLVPQNKYERYGSSPVELIQPHEGSHGEVYKALKAASVGRNFTVYNRSEIPERWHYSHNRRITDIIVVADLGFVFEDFEQHETNPSKKLGMHGYDNACMSMKSFFIGYGPRFKQDFTIDPFDNIDLFPLIASMMGFEPAPNNGSLEKVSGMLSGSPSGINGWKLAKCSLILCVIGVLFGFTSQL